VLDPAAADIPPLLIVVGIQNVYARVTYLLATLR
jgi:hypothetical protein